MSKTYNTPKRTHIVKTRLDDEKDFLDRSDAIAWICKNQLGRRNLTPEQKKLSHRQAV